MRFAFDILITLIGLALMASVLVTILAVVGYFQGAGAAETLQVLQVTVPIIVVSGGIAWWQRDVLWSAIAWLF